MPGAPSLAETQCVLQHRLFSRLPDPVFRRSDVDGQAVVVLQLGEKEAVVPLASLAREFGITPESEDGRMLALIAEALDFVTAIRPGDRLPKEVLTGEASWTPDQVHFELASAKLRLQLVDWLNSGNGPDRRGLGTKLLLQIAGDPALRPRVQEALARAAGVLGLESGSAVLDLIERLGRELAYIEALRDRLLGRLRGVIERIQGLAPGFRGDATITQVRRLSGIGLRQMAARFAELDAQTGEVVPALRNIDQHKAFIRCHRDWLYRRQKAWEPIMAEWEGTDGEPDPATKHALVGRTYQFLAPRFMPVTEWESVGNSRRIVRKSGSERMVW